MNKVSKPVCHAYPILVLKIGKLSSYVAEKIEEFVPNINEDV